MSDESIPTRKRRVHPGKRGPKYTVRQEELAKKRNEALELRKSGLSYPQIAVRMSLSTPMQAWRYVNDAIADIPKERALEVRDLMLASIDTDLARLNNLHATAKTVADVTKIIMAKDRLRDSKARLLGINAPTAHEHTFLNQLDVRTLTDDQIDRALSGDLTAISGNGVAASPRAGEAQASGAEGSDRHPRPTH